MKKSEWLDCQRNEFFPKQKGVPSPVKIGHKNTATLDSARSKKKSKVAVLQLGPPPTDSIELMPKTKRNIKRYYYTSSRQFPIRCSQNLPFCSSKKKMKK